MAAQQPPARALPASVQAPLQALDAALRAGTREECLEAASQRGAAFDAFVEAARTALAAEALALDTAPLPPFALADTEGLRLLIEGDGDVDGAACLRALALDAAVGRAVRHALNAADPKRLDLDAPMDQLEGVPADMERLLGDDRCRAKAAVREHALGARVEHALVASQIAYYGGEATTLQWVVGRWQSKTRNLETDRILEHVPVYLFEEEGSVAPTVLVRTPKSANVEAGDALYVASCGSRTNWRDWACTNIKVKGKKVMRERPSVEAPSDAPADQVMELHLGFWQAFKAQAARVIDAIQAQLKLEPAKEVVFTGHSLGGAVARLLAIEWAAVSGTRPHLVTFGSPRGGDAAFQERVLEATAVYQRVRTRGDPVPGILERVGYVPDAAHQHWVVHDGGSAYNHTLEMESAQSVSTVGEHSLYQYASGLLAHYDALLSLAGQAV